MSEGRFKVTDADKRYNTPAWKNFMGGNPAYMYVPLKKAKHQNRPKGDHDQRVNV